MNLSSYIKQSSEYKPLQYLLTLPPMSNIRGIGENGFKFKVIGEKGLYKYKSQTNLTLKELINLLPNQKYQFEIEFKNAESTSEKDFSYEIKSLNKIYERTKNPKILERLNELRLKNDFTRRRVDTVLNPELGIKLNFALSDYLKNPNYIYEYLNKLENKLQIPNSSILKSLGKYLPKHYILPFLLSHDNRRMASEQYLKALRNLVCMIGTNYVYIIDAKYHGNKYRKLDQITEEYVNKTRKSTLEKWKEAIEMVDKYRNKKSIPQT